MTIDIKDNSIIIKDEEVLLTNIVKSQLSFWGFKKKLDGTYWVKHSDSLLLKVVTYLTKEGFSINKTENINNSINQLQLRDLNFQSLKKVAAKYKSGILEDIKFIEFRTSVSTYIKRPLKHHQLKAAFHLYLINNGANFSVPGSGKTSVILTVYEKLRMEGKVNTLFVVGPPSCFGPWKHEFEETIQRPLNYKILAGGNKSSRKKHYYLSDNGKSELYLTTFQSFLYDQTEIEYFLNSHLNKAYFVIDEAHYIKQINGNWANALLNHSNSAKYRCILTGTPFPKSYTDIYNLFDFLWPKQSPISQENKIKIKLYEEQGKTEEAKEILNELIGPLFYRVRKSDLKLGKQNFLSPYLITMNPYEAKVYRAIYTRIKEYSKNDFFQNIDFVSKLCKGRIIRLRQAISYVGLLSNAIENYNEILFEGDSTIKKIIYDYNSLELPAKLQYLINLVKKLHSKKKKVVIWSNFIITINLIENHLKKDGFYCKKIYGNTPIESSSLKDEETREKIRNEFVNPDSGLDILIANPAACAESISLHKTCHDAIYYDLSYNCAQYLQSLDRIHRVGGSEYIEVNYHFLQYQDTIDSDIKANIDKKVNKMFEIIEEDYAIYSLDMFEEDGDIEAYNRLFKTI